MGSLESLAFEKGADVHRSKMALFVVGVAVVLAACGGGGASDGESGPSAPAPAPVTPPAADPQPNTESDIRLPCETLGISVGDLPSRWNEFIAEVGLGFELPDPLVATGTVLNLNEYVGYLDDSQTDLFAVNVYWDPDTEQVREITLYGPVLDETTSIALTVTAGAMVYAATSLTSLEAEALLVERLMSEVDEFSPGGFVSGLVEEDGRVFRFSLVADTADWSAVGNLPCP